MADIPDPPPGYIVDPLLEASRRKAVPPPPEGYTSAEEPSFWARWSGAQPGPLIPSATPDQGSFLPIRRTPTGREFDYSAGALGSLLRALTSPGDVALGAVPTPYETGQPNPDLTGRAIETAGVVSPISPSYRAGARYGTAVPGAFTYPPVPATQAISEAADAGYNAVRRSGWQVPSTAVTDTAKTATGRIGTDFTPTEAPSTFARIGQMADPTRSVTSMTELMSHRDALTRTIGRGGPDAVAARQVRDTVDQLINNLDQAGAHPQPSVTPTMPVENVAGTLQTAKANTRAAQTANRLSGDLDPAVKGILDQVELGAAASGNYNVDAQLRNRAAAILKDNKNVSSLLPDERAALEEVANGTTTRNFLRTFGRRYGGSDIFHIGVASGQGGGLGYALGGPVGAGIGATALPLIGSAAKMAGSGLTKSALQALEERVRSNSPLYEGLLAAGRPFPVPSLGRDEAIIRAIFGGGLLAPPPKTPGFI